MSRRVSISKRAVSISQHAVSISDTRPRGPLGERRFRPGTSLAQKVTQRLSENSLQNGPTDMTLSIRFRWNAAACGVLLLILAAGAIAAATRVHSAIIAVLGIAFMLGVILIVAVDRYAAELINELRAV